MFEKGSVAHDWSPNPEANKMNLAKSDLQNILNCITDIFQIDMKRSLNATSQYNYFNDSSFYLYNYSFSGASTEYYPYQSETGTSATLSPIPVDRGSLGHGVQISFDLVVSASGGTFVPVLNGYPVSDLGLSPTPIKSGTNSYSFFTKFPADTDSSKSVGFGLKISNYTGTLKISNLEININDSFTATQSAYSTLESKINSIISSMSDTDTVNLFLSGIFDDLSNYFVSRDTIAQSVGAYGIYVGTNLSLIEPNVSQMSTLIQDAKNIFSSGLIFYRTNWWVTATWSQSTIDAYNTKLNYAFWQYVDVIAIASYFEITDELNPSSETLQRELSSTEIYARKQDIVTEIKNFHTKWGKPIYFGELGIPPYSNASSKPYVTQMDTTATYNEAVQANWFDAWYTVFSQFDWWLGYSIFTIADSTSPYNPYGKQASSIIRMQTFGGESKPTTSISVSEPSVPNTNDIWLVADVNKNITAIKKWNGTSWDNYKLKLG